MILGQEVSKLCGLVQLYIVIAVVAQSGLFATHGLQHARSPVPHHLLEFAQIQVHCIGDADSKLVCTHGGFILMYGKTNTIL